MNILVTTMGTTWAVVPELLAFTNPEQLPLYANHPRAADFAAWRTEYDIQPVAEVWVITTNGQRVLAERAKLEIWADLVGFKVTQYSDPRLLELGTVEECRLMSDLVYRVVLAARESADHLYLSLAGGRKTMSADLQQAGNLFGCRTILHVVDSNTLPDSLRNPQPESLLEPLSASVAAAVSPLIVCGRLTANPVLDLQPPIKAVAFPVLSGEPPRLLEETARRLRHAAALLCNYRRQLVGGDQTNFRALYTLDPGEILRLRETRVGDRPEDREQDIAWLRTLPKTELHCHFGGILSPAEMIEVAAAEAGRIGKLRSTHTDFDAWLGKIRELTEPQNSARLKTILSGSGRELRNLFPGIPEPCAVAGFLLQFKDRTELLDQTIYGHLRSPQSFCGVGIETYERLGDLQGSGLLQSEAAIRAACRILVRQCAAANVAYCELRISPCNYTRGGLAPERVVQVVLDALEDAAETSFRLIFIASRHGSMERVRQHIELAQRLLAGSRWFAARFVGFDLAGAESAMAPEALRKDFLPLMERCLKLTIHAGEGEPVANIWQAAYHLNADRIGHGLTLIDQPELLNRFLDRRIALELCPSSNFQIVGFRDFQLPGTESLTEYPLRNYLDRGLSVTVNTDDPGISRTGPVLELYKAACMTRGGLSRWQILQLLRNGFRAGFAPFAERRELLLAAEQKIMDNLHT